MLWIVLYHSLLALVVVYMDSCGDIETVACLLLIVVLGVSLYDLSQYFVVQLHVVQHILGFLV